MIQPNYQSRRAITLVETVVSTLLIGFVLVSTLQIVGPMINSSTIHTDRLVAANLANELTEEIATKFWTSPILNDPESMGPGAGETRPTYDDIDDYDGWSSSPPKLSNGATNFALTGWTRSVEVNHVLLNSPSTSSANSTGLKKVVVRVYKDGILHADIRSLHSQAGDKLGFVLQAQGG